MFALVLLCFACLPLGQETQPAMDLSVSPQAGRQMALVLTSKQVGKLFIEELELERDIKVERSLVLIDQFQRSASHGLAMGRRVLKWHRTEEGQVRDPEFNGISFVFEKDAGETLLSIEGDASLGADALERMYAQQHSIGAQLKAPKEARLGGSYQIRFDALGALMLDTPSLPLAMANLKWTRFDAKSSRATLEGGFNASAKALDDQHSMELLYSGKASLVLDLSAHCIVEFSLKGELTGEGTIDGEDANTEASLSAKLSVKLGSQAAKLARSKPGYRDRLFTVPGEGGVEFKLPNTWRYVEILDDEEAHGYIDREDGSRFLRVEVYASSNPKLLLQEAENSMLDTYPSSRAGSVRTKAGSGRSLTFRGPDFELQMDLIPKHNLLVQIQLRTEPGQLKSRMPALKKLRRTLIING